MRPKLPPQILRLVLLTLGIIGSYLVARTLLTPGSFGQYGHYRGAALEEMASRDPVFAGWKACDECHSDTRELQAKHEHRGISCESCHGPARAHAANPDLKTAAIPELLCLRCHSKSVARPLTQKQINPSDHFEGKCLECHLPHNPKESP